MNEKMKEEILDSWNSWKYDIKDMNRSEWTVRDESILGLFLIRLNFNSEETIVFSGSRLKHKSILMTLNSGFL